MNKRDARKATKAAILFRTNELAGMRAELADLDSRGLTDDLKAMLLRDGIRATEYLLSLLLDEQNEPEYDARFLARNRPKETK